MRFGVSSHYQRTLLRGAAVLLIGALAAGCSSDVMRFQDSILTGSSHPNQRPAAVSQAYPGDSGLDQTHTGSIASGARRPGLLNRVARTPRPQGDVGGWSAASAPVQNPYPVNTAPSYAAAPSGQVTSRAALAPVTRASLDNTVTGTTSPAVAAVRPPIAPQAPAPQAPAQQPVVAADNEGGWSRAGGTQVSVKPGETVYNLSRRFGVPADAILRANGMSSANQLAAGQQVVIPTYVHSARAPVSAPDSDRNVADARSSTGTRYDVPADRVPVPGRAPAERLAVLPQQPKLNEKQAVAAPTAGGAQTGAASAGASYTVAAGDTLSGIARKTGVSTEALKQANGLSNGLIRIGQTLMIPTGGASTVVATAPKVDNSATGSTPAPQTAAYTPPRPQAEKVIQQAALDNSQAPDATGISRMRWPVRGRVISGFGAANRGAKNDGIDIAVPAGTPIKAAENGVVIYAGDGLKELGNTVLVRHEDGLVTVYGHASELKVQRGQKVRRGEDIALAGMSGSAETPKLHFEVRKDSTPVNPATYLE